ncbi:uncharacterized protein LOC134247229 [Saccostrea cucullata]|uniref:uncharacterized protein LOC134247229 n=1 Tax=Saccostrea cuccullata TaxID=36930 RepID=UPI002ED50BC9
MSFFASGESNGTITMTVPQKDNVKVSQREKKVYVNPDLPLSNIGHLLSGERNASQYYGKMDKFGIYPQGPVHLQSTDFQNFPDKYDFKKAGILHIGTTKSQSMKKAMAPRSNQDFPGLLEADLTEKPRKYEREKEAQEDQSTTDTITDELFSQLLEADGDSSVLDCRMSTSGPSKTQGHVTLDQNQDLTPDIQPTPESQYTLNPQTKVWSQDRCYQGNQQGEQWALESVCCEDQGIKDQSHLDKTGLQVLHEVIELESDTGQESLKKLMVQNSGGMSIDEVTYEDLLIEIDSTDLIGYDTRTNNAKKEYYGESSKDTEVIKNQKYHHGTETTAASGEVTCGDLLIDLVPGIVDPKEVSQQHSLKEIIKNQESHGYGTAASGPVTHGNLLIDSEILKLLECVNETADSIEESQQQQLPKDHDLMKNQVAHGTRPTACIAPTCGNLLQNTGFQNLRSDTKGADFEKVTRQNLLKDSEWVMNQIGHHTGMAFSQAVGCGVLPNKLMNRTVHDTKTADRKEEAYETLPANAKLMANNLPHFTTKAVSKSVVCNNLFTEIEIRKEQMSYNTGAVNTNNGVFNETEGNLRKFAQNHTRLSSSVCTDEIPKTSTKIDLTDEMTSEEIMSENEGLKKRLVKRRLKRKLLNQTNEPLQKRTNEPASKVRKILDASQNFQNDCQIGFYEENGEELNNRNQREVVESSQQDLTESNILVEKQFPELNTWENEYLEYQEANFGNIPNLDDLGVNVYDI